MVYAEMLYLCKNKLGYTNKEALHIYYGEYQEQFEIYKKYHNMEINKMVFITDENKKDSRRTSDNDAPAWYTKYMKEKEKGARNGK